MNTTNYWHFRGSTVASSEDNPNDSLMLPVDSITGIAPGYAQSNVSSSSHVTIFYKKPSTYSNFSANSDIPTQNGMITLGITPEHAREVLEFLAQASNSSNNKKSYLTIADDLNSEYAFRHIVSHANLITA